MKELSVAEWNIMESLWEDSPKVGSRVVSDMAIRTGWSRSTTLTMLKRMTQKGLIACEESGQIKAYVSLVDREEAVKKETESFLNRVYHGSVSMMLNGFVEKQRLSREDIRELREILEKAEDEYHD